MSGDYRDYLGNVTMEELGEALKKSGVGWNEPDDPSVGSYNSYLQGGTSIVVKGDGKVLKIQTNYKDYSLTENEARVLELCSGKHVPTLLRRAEEGIEIEDCGDHLTVDNLPEDWKQQLIQILGDLKSFGVNHNDIKQDNLMIKDGVIKLIDFGWSSLEGEDISHFPDCLGVPNRSPWGPDDNYSMKAVIRQITYLLEGENA